MTTIWQPERIKDFK